MAQKKVIAVAIATFGLGREFAGEEHDALGLSPNSIYMDQMVLDNYVSRSYYEYG